MLAPHALKLFPAEGASPAVLKAQLAVIPKDVPVLVVGGVKPDNMQPWLDAGATASALASGLYKPGQSRPRRSTRHALMLPAFKRMKPIRIAILGFGKIAADQHVPAIKGNPRFELVATSSRSGEGVGQKFADWRELIRSIDSLEAVAITTPPDPRYDIARECMLAGLHCLLEKPPTSGTAEIADLDCLAKARRATLFTTWHAQHHATVDAAAQALAGKRIQSLAIHWHEDVHKWHPGQQWIWEPGGFGVFDPGINAFSIATKIFPGGLFVRSAELHVPKNAQTPIAADVVFSSPEADGALTASLDWRRSEG